MQPAPPLMSGSTLGISAGRFQLRLEIDQSRICSPVSACQCSPLKPQAVLLTPFAGGSCIATIASSCSSMCLQGCTIVRPDSASDCKWRIKRASSHSVVADLANGCLVNIIQESGDFSECVCPCALSRNRSQSLAILCLVLAISSYFDHQNLR